MPCCLVIIFSLLVPRIMILILWLFTGWFKGIFSSAIWPVLGFIFLPLTLLWYTAVHNWYNGQWGFLQILVLILAVAIDLSPGGHKKARSGWRRRNVEPLE